MTPSVYSGALNAGEENGAFVDRVGDNLSEEYDSIDQMKIAISEKVDGILLDYDGSSEMQALIEEAQNAGIPVVTMVRDSTGSGRISYVGVSYYTLGQQYAGEIQKLLSIREKDGKEPYEVYLMMDEEFQDSSRTIITSTIQNALDDVYEAGEVELIPYSVDESSSFEAEESIRTVFTNTEDLPDIILCLDETCSTSVYQELIDSNQVGNVDMIAYYTSKEILEGVSKNIIASTIGVDTANIGSYGTKALLEYTQTGYTSDYYAVDTYVIDQSNIDEYIGAIW